MSKRFIIAGGGTGGHIFPAIAIANALKAALPTAQFLFVGAKGKMEMEKVPQAGYEIKGLDIAGFNRASLLKNIGLPWKLFKSFLQVRSIFKVFKPDAVIGVGGYSSFPVLRFAQARGIASFIHESNSFAGKSNILLGKNATAVFVATAGMEQFFPKEKIVVTGNPVRAAIAKRQITRKEATDFFGIEADKQTVLVIGGSLGARSINDAIAARLASFSENNLQLIWQTGKTDAEKYASLSGSKKNIFVQPFIQQMEYAYAAADIVVSRAGAMAVTELCIVGKATVFVPFPHAAEDHQTANARQLVDDNAAWMVKDADAKKELVDKVLALARDTDQQTALSNAIKRLAIVDADIVIAQQIIKAIA